MTPDFSMFGFMSGLLVIAFTGIFYSIWKDIRQIDKSHPWERDCSYE
jgi:hypothetical protein